MSAVQLQPQKAQKPERMLPALDIRQRHTIDETAAYLRCCRAKVYQKIKAGEIRVLKDGRRTYIPGDEIARLSRLPEQSAA